MCFSGDGEAAMDREREAVGAGTTAVNTGAVGSYSCLMGGRLRVSRALWYSSLSALSR